MKVLSRSRHAFSSHSLLRRTFSTQTLANTTILVSNGLGQELPQEAQTYLKERGAELDVMERNLTAQQRPGELLQQIKRKPYDALYVCLEDVVSADIIDGCPALQMISTMSVGFNHIDIAKCKQKGIKVGYTPEVLTDTTADLVLALTLATARKLVTASRAVYDGSWGAWTPLWMAGKDVHGSTVGIVGFGRIGQAVAKRFQGFGCKVLYCNGSGIESAAAKHMGAEFVSFDELLERSDFVVPMCPLTPATNLLFKDEQFKKMRKDAMFINASRGDVVCQDSLVRALKSGEIMAAGLDVTTPEPLPVDHDLCALENCTILPHIGSGSVATRVNMSIVGAQNIECVIKGQDPIYAVC